MKTTLFILWCTVSVVCLGLMITDIHHDYQDYVKSGECIAHYISLGVERSSIYVDGPKCYVLRDFSLD